MSDDKDTQTNPLTPRMRAKIQLKLGEAYLEFCNLTDGGQERAARLLDHYLGTAIEAGETPSSLLALGKNAIGEGMEESVFLEMLIFVEEWRECL